MTQNTQALADTLQQVLGGAIVRIKQALGEVRGIRRYGTGFAPLDEVRSTFALLLTSCR